MIEVEPRSAQQTGPGRYRESQRLWELAQRTECNAATADQVVETDRMLPGAYPLYAARARGAHIWDVDGHRYLDFILAYGTVVLGHAHPAVNAAAIRAVRSGVTVTLNPELQVQLSELIASVVPGADLTLLFKTGSDATSAAVRLARAFTGRDRVLRWGYNGWHDWCCPRETGIPQATRDLVGTFDYDDADSLRRALRRHARSTAAVIMMPFLLQPPAPGYLAEVRRITAEHDVLLVFDELRSGFRVALGGAQELFGVTADLATFGKAMSNGFAISALTGRRDIMRCAGRTHLASTYYVNTPAMAAALATIGVLRTSPVLEHIKAMGERLQAGLRRLTEEHGIPARVTGYPQMPFLEFDCPPDRQARVKRAFYARAAELGVLFHPNHHWFICGATTKGQLDRTLAVCDRALAAARAVLVRP